ncbi:cysteine--tRNA ligase [uncultured Ilyobacter sp.]|uniref:cysteine--tRNA ligase n=1 Tax=uncultured Ilyobacter sp. TaxID=544433 RepID=UPI0029F5CA3E|nr:cysteine--tRNA ligase [uncultured Ilyobacter sp.]
MLRIFNTLKGKIEEFKPLKEGEVSMYVCGPTVYNYIHIGNARPAIFFDTVRRYLEYRGYNVKYVQNFTDVDDKMIKRANEEGITLKEVADKYIAAYFEDTAKVNLKEDGMLRPKATEHIGEMIKLIKALIEKDFAYEVQGDVYFSVKSYNAKYGELSKQNTDDLQSGSRVDVNDIKRSPLDFALWKAAKDGEPSWGSPWGKGRPGWHIECSAMSNKYLGPTFDIHGGGQDLIFPHHENEIAQSKCATGGDFARYWIHNGYINVKGEKMSKSLGNFFLLREVLEKYEGKVVRFFVLSSHYRKPIDFSEDELNQAKAAVERIENSLMRLLEKMDERDSAGDHMAVESLEKSLEESKNKFIAAMDEDFNTSQGIGAIFELIKEMNKFMAGTSLDAEGREVLKAASDFIKEAVIEVLGVDIKVEKKVGNMTSELVDFILEIRQNARVERNWALSDQIRDRLSDMGVKIKDGKDKTTWSI